MEKAKIFAAAELEFDTFPRLIDALGLKIEKDMAVAIKVDFLQPCPAIVQPLFLALAQRGASPFLTDCSVPFGDALQSLNAAAMNGYVSGAPCVLADGVKGTDYDLIPVRGGKRLRSAKFGRALMDADLIITVTRPAFSERGFRGVLYDLGLGCAARAGKTEVQTSGKPIVDAELCIGCGKCAAICEHGGARLDPDTRKASIFPPKCSGCSRCMRACPVNAIRPNFDISDETVLERLAEYAKALCDAKEHAHLVLLDQAYASLDPTALDALCAEKLSLPESACAAARHAAALSFGTTDAEITEI
jgi:uncharacterized Fe-S center protein